jgi:predicted DsbA family dithiol-disulfide isomerase
MTKPLSVDVVSDVVCPWCYIGKRKLQEALLARTDILPEIRWRPFFLDPTVPAEGKSREDYIVGKFGSLERIKPAQARMNAIGSDLGIDFRFDAIERQPNTLDAHRMIGWASEAGRGDAMVEELFAAFFTEGADLTRQETLIGIGARAGMKREAIAEALQSDRDVEQVRRQAQAASASGIGGVPFFVFGGKIALSGAQDPEVLSSAIDQALASQP